MTGRGWLTAAALAIGCGGGVTSPPPLPDASAPYPVEVTLGGANPDGSGFTTLAGDLTMVRGGQGGFHVWVKYRVTGAGAERVLLDYTARRMSDGRLILTNSNVLVMLGAPGSEGYWESQTPIPALHVSQPARHRRAGPTHGVPFRGARSERRPARQRHRHLHPALPDRRSGRALRGDNG